MKPNSCPREPEVIAALLWGTLAGDLRAHTSVCEVCCEIARVTQALVADVVPAFSELRPPHATVVWRRAQSLARKKTIARATQPIRIARISTWAAAAIALPWLLVSLPNSLLWIPGFAHHLRTVDLSFSSAATASILLGVLGSLFLITLSSWYVLCQE
jgi:hypothetical protein